MTITESMPFLVDPLFYIVLSALIGFYVFYKFVVEKRLNEEYKELDEEDKVTDEEESEELSDYEQFKKDRAKRKKR